MLRTLLAVALASAATPLAAQSRGTQPGDSVTVVVHRVRPGAARLSSMFLKL